MEAVFAVPDDEGSIDRAEQALCLMVGESLTQAYPGYVWNVGCTRQSGALTIKLAVPLSLRPGGFGEPGYLLYISTVIGPGGHKRVLAAGGEILERWALIRGSAKGDWVEHAWENGLDKSHMILKSKA